jgi:GDPmannose 4,6-dehydratase
VPRALITGITGQDGSYLAELLLGKGYEVHGLVRSGHLGHVEPIRHVLTLHRGDLADETSLRAALDAARPDEIYNLAALSSVAYSWEEPVRTGDTSGLGAVRLLEAVRAAAPNAHVFQASSNEVFGRSDRPVQDETTPLRPVSPYGAAKAYAQTMTASYREGHGMFCCSGILFNHESPRRGMQFVTRKIAWHAAAIKRGEAVTLALGNTTSQRDWGFAGDYVEAMWLMLQQHKPDDFVLATGRPHTVQDFVERAFARLGLDWREHVRVEDALKRPREAAVAAGDATKAGRELGWEARTSFDDLVAMMVDADL